MEVRAAARPAERDELIVSLENDEITIRAYLVFLRRRGRNDKSFQPSDEILALERSDPTRILDKKLSQLNPTESIKLGTLNWRISIVAEKGRVKFKTESDEKSVLEAMIQEIIDGQGTPAKVTVHSSNTISADIIKAFCASKAPPVECVFEKEPEPKQKQQKKEAVDEASLQPANPPVRPVR